MHNPFATLLNEVRLMVDQCLIDFGMEDTPANRYFAAKTLKKVVQKKFGTEEPTFGQSMTLIALTNLEMEYLEKKVQQDMNN